MSFPTPSTHNDSSHDLVNQQRQWISSHFPHLFTLLGCYLALVAFGPRAMGSHKPFNLKTPLIFWNLGLAIFSIIGAVITSEFAFPRMFTQGAYYSLCREGTMFEGANGRILWYFTLSKVIELGDTVFLVLRKRPVSLLHWYHHATVLVFCWYQYTFPTAPSQWGVTVNLIVHSFMYTYFAVRALGVWLPKWVSICVTCIQLTQFVIGVWCCWVCFQAVVLNPPAVKLCDITPGVAIAQFFIYITYLMLFSHFFYTAYCQRRPRIKVGEESRDIYQNGNVVKNGYLGNGKEANGVANGGLEGMDKGASNGTVGGVVHNGFHGGMNGDMGGLKKRPINR